MPEYFDISFILKKTSTSQSELLDYLNQYGLAEGDNTSELFDRKQVVIDYVEDDASDFDEICLGIPEQIFTEENFENELQAMTNFVNQCIRTCSDYIRTAGFAFLALQSLRLNRCKIPQIKCLSLE